MPGELELKRLVSWGKRKTELLTWAYCSYLNAHFIFYCLRNVEIYLFLHYSYYYSKVIEMPGELELKCLVSWGKRKTELLTWAYCSYLNAHFIFYCLRNVEIYLFLHHQLFVHPPSSDRLRITDNLSIRCNIGYNF